MPLTKSVRQFLQISKYRYVELSTSYQNTLQYSPISYVKTRSYTKYINDIRRKNISHLQINYSTKPSHSLSWHLLASLTSNKNTLDFWCLIVLMLTVHGDNKMVNFTKPQSGHVIRDPDPAHSMPMQSCEWVFVVSRRTTGDSDMKKQQLTLAPQSSHKQ